MPFWVEWDFNSGSRYTVTVYRSCTNIIYFQYVWMLVSSLCNSFICTHISTLVSFTDDFEDSLLILNTTAIRYITYINEHFVIMNGNAFWTNCSKQWLLGVEIISWGEIHIYFRIDSAWNKPCVFLPCTTNTSALILKWGGWIWLIFVVSFCAISNLCYIVINLNCHFLHACVLYFSVWAV